jgi:hypothetical protein
LAASAINLLAVATFGFTLTRTGAILLLVGAAVACHALRIFESSVQTPKVNGVHSSFPFFLRMSYAWLPVAASLGIWAALDGDPSGGIGGASRHALTVGFVSLMIFAVGQRVLPAFCGMKILFSTQLMFWSMLLATAGCALRVVSEVLAYPGYVAAAWRFLPVSAVIELTAFTLFSINLFVTLVRRRPGIPAKLYRIAAKNSYIA